MGVDSRRRAPHMGAVQARIKKEKKVRFIVDFSWDSDILFSVMSNMLNNVYTVQMPNGDTVELPRLEGELAKAIQLASDNGTVVKFGDEVIWQPEA